MGKGEGAREGERVLERERVWEGERVCGCEGRGQSKKKSSKRFDQKCYLSFDTFNGSSEELLS